MEISEKELAEILDNLNRFLHSIETLEDLKKHRDKTIYFGCFDSIEIKDQISENKTMYIISYIRETVGIPIEVRIDYGKRSSTIILKCQNWIREFDPFPFPFAQDPLGNLYQSKVLPYTNLELVKNELKNLEEYLSSI